MFFIYKYFGFQQKITIFVMLIYQTITMSQTIAYVFLMLCGSIITFFFVNSLIMKYIPKKTKFYSWWEKYVCGSIN
jgi:hypothetical protein